MFWRHSRALSKDTRASSPARLRLSFARRSLVCAPLTEGEHTDADASRWRRDDRVLHLIEVECVILSSRSTSSCHCFMAPGEAVELGGCHNNSLATVSAPEKPLMESGMFAQPCAAVQRAQQQCLARGGWELAAWRKHPLSPPLNPPKSWHGAQRFAPSCLSKETSKNLKPSPLPGAPNVGEQISGRVAECTRPKS
jgi:hypothetical protein